MHAITSTGKHTRDDVAQFEGQKRVRTEKGYVTVLSNMQSPTSFGEANREIKPTISLSSTTTNQTITTTIFPNNTNLKTENRLESFLYSLEELSAKIKHTITNLKALPMIYTKLESLHFSVPLQLTQEGSNVLQQDPNGQKIIIDDFIDNLYLKPEIIGNDRNKVEDISFSTLRDRKCTLNLNGSQASIDVEVSISDFPSSLKNMTVYNVCHNSFDLLNGLILIDHNITAGNANFKKWSHVTTPKGVIQTLLNSVQWYSDLPKTK